MNPITPEEGEMFGRLPRLHRDLVVTVVLATFTALGAWAIYVSPIRFSPGVGAVLGMAIGGLLAYASVHDFRRPAVRTVHIRHR